jgi:hypothetical protein
MSDRPIWSSQQSKSSKRFLVMLFIAVVGFAGMSRLEFFREYLGALWLHWIALMSGIVSVGITFWEKIHNSIGKYVLYTVAAMCVFLAGFQAWQDEHRIVVTARQPQLIGSFGESIGIAKNPNDSVLIVVGVIKNKGAPTVLDHWRLNVKLNDGRSVDASLVVQPPPQVVTELIDPITGSRESLLPSDQWVQKTRDTAVTAEKAAVGWLASRVSGIKADEFAAKKATFTLSCDDVNGHTWTFTDTIDSRQGQRILDMKDVVQDGPLPEKSK